MVDGLMVTTVETVDYTAQLEAIQETLTAIYSLCFLAVLVLCAVGLSYMAYCVLHKFF